MRISSRPTRNPGGKRRGFDAARHARLAGWRGDAGEGRRGRVGGLLDRRMRHGHCRVRDGRTGFWMGEKGRGKGGLLWLRGVRLVEGRLLLRERCGGWG